MNNPVFETMMIHSIMMFGAYEGKRWIVHKDQKIAKHKLQCADPIQISAKLHEQFCQMIESWRHPSGHYWYMNTGWVLGADQDGRIVDARQIGEDQNGNNCASFISYTTATSQEAFIDLIRIGLNPIGFCRVCSASCATFRSLDSFLNQFYWDKSKMYLKRADWLYLNYQPEGPEMFRADGNLYPYQLFENDQVSVPLPVGEIECGEVN